MSSTALALNDDFLREVAGMASSEDSGSIQTLSVMKVNYDGDSIHPLGSWVLGQKKSKESVITEEGLLVKGMVILAKRNRWSYYDENDTTKNCNSPLHNQGESVIGSNYRNKCGKGCMYRAEGRDPRCQAQVVVFALALTSEDKLVECVAYIKGANYMPLVNYVEEMTKVKSGSKFITVPTFTFLTMLASNKQKKGTVTYWVGEYSRGPAFSMEQIRGFDEKRTQVQSYIDSINSGIASTTSAHSAPTGSGSAPAAGRAEVVDDIPDFRPSVAGVVEDAPWAGATGEPVDDIEAAIAKAMSGMKP